ncbi:MAG: FAD-dependent oxidoreductase, partial [Gammaproteobacteria bacterium]|nr:FAD-dependent oxidoreductase [Gammaproteobacteria bacterium]
MSDACDVLVIGAGIHGAGAAQAAAAAGYTVRVLEKAGVAAATSCRSSKLIHGGLRYLETGQYDLVRESLRERAILLRIAPQLVRLVPFHIPVYRETRRSRLTLRAGLMLYAALGDFRRESWFRTLPRREWASLDGLETRGLKAVFRYQDGQTDDAALTQAVLRSAQTLDAELILPGEFLDATRIPDGYRVRYRSTHGEEECVCRVLINASGPWINDTLARITPRPPQPAVELVQGAHVVLEGALVRGAYYTEAEDGRAV